MIGFQILILIVISLQWRHNGHDNVSNQQPHDCLRNRLFRRRSKKTSKLRVTCLCAGNSPVTGEFPAQMASNAENVSIWWRHHVSRQFVSSFVKHKINLTHEDLVTHICVSTLLMIGYGKSCLSPSHCLNQHDGNKVLMMIKCEWIRCSLRMSIQETFELIGLLDGRLCGDALPNHYLNQWRLIANRTIGTNFNKVFNLFRLGKWIWRCCLQYFGHFVPVSMC